jgi:predicted nuclease of predicted toxin-antitoxin system
MQPFLARSESKFHSKMIKLKIDENLPNEVAQHFNQRGRNVQTVLDQNLKGCTDEILLRICQEEKRILVTLDLDFSNITLYPPGTYEGIIVFRVKNQSKNSDIELAFFNG